MIKTHQFSSLEPVLHNQKLFEVTIRVRCETAAVLTFGDWPLLVGNPFNSAKYERNIVRHGGLQPPTTDKLAEILIAALSLTPLCRHPSSNPPLEAAPQRL